MCTSLQEEPNAGESLMLENTPEQQENQSEQEPADAHALKVEEDSVASLTEEQPKQNPKLLLLPEDANAHKTLSGPEPRKGKLPPLTIVPPIRKIHTLYSTTQSFSPISNSV